jgi:hypothetical protein
VRRLARHSFTAVTAISLLLLVAWAVLRWLGDHNGAMRMGERADAWADGDAVHLQYFTRPAILPEDWFWEGPGVSIGAGYAHDVLDSGPARIHFLRVSNRVALPTLSAPPVAWVMVWLMRRRKRARRGFDVRPVRTTAGEA